MTKRTLSLLLAIAAPLAATAAGPSGKAVLRNAGGVEVGIATFMPAPGGVEVQIQVTGLSPGNHGVHIHAVGKCEGPDFKTAGGHFNPFARKHGLLNPEGAHAGDLANLAVGANGIGKASFTAKGAALREGPGSLFGPEGTALVIHAAADDEKSDPAGNSGARIACGVIERK